MAKPSSKKKSPQSQTKEQKERLLVELTKVPVVQIACQRIGVGRATYYSWRETDVEFRKTADKAISEGNFVINDLAESKLISNIQDGNNTSIIFWLKNHHGGYNDRIIHEHEHSHSVDLDEEQQAKIVKALYNIGYANIIKLNEQEAEEIVAEHKATIKKRNDERLQELREAKLAEKGEEVTAPVVADKIKKKGGVNLTEFFKRRNPS
jgi:hypothetical protein